MLNISLEVYFKHILDIKFKPYLFHYEFILFIQSNNFLKFKVFFNSNLHNLPSPY